MNVIAVGRILRHGSIFVSYTHLDVYKRQDHFHRFLSLKIGEDAPSGGSASGESETKDPEVLTAEAVIEFAFLPESSVERGVFLTAFEKSSFDYSIVEELRVRASREIPLLDASPSGRSNPFLR